MPSCSITIRAEFAIFGPARRRNCDTCIRDDYVYEVWALSQGIFLEAWLFFSLSNSLILRRKTARAGRDDGMGSNEQIPLNFHWPTHYSISEILDRGSH